MSNEQDYLEIDLSELRQLPEAERVSRLADHLWAMNEFLEIGRKALKYDQRQTLSYLPIPYLKLLTYITSQICDVCEGLTEVRDSLKAK